MKELKAGDTFTFPEGSLLEFLIQKDFVVLDFEAEIDEDGVFFNKEQVQRLLDEGHLIRSKNKIVEFHDVKPGMLLSKNAGHYKILDKTDKYVIYIIGYNYGSYWDDEEHVKVLDEEQFNAKRFHKLEEEK